MIKDGFLLFYCKDKKIHPVVMSFDQMDNLQLFIPAIMGSKTIQVVDEPCGDVYNMKDSNL